VLVGFISSLKRLQFHSEGNIFTEDWSLSDVTACIINAWFLRIDQYAMLCVLKIEYCHGFNGQKLKVAYYSITHNNYLKQML
jgi:hypothetical protein